INERYRKRVNYNEAFFFYYKSGSPDDYTANTFVSLNVVDRLRNFIEVFGSSTAYRLIRKYKRLTVEK
ncbi:Hypothetical predicted protein, partial [Mytilus galloprovincialis]